MTYEDALYFEQEQYRANLQAGEEFYQEGKADGAFGYPAQYADDTYLMGYCAGLKELPIEKDGRIKRFPDETEAPVQFEAPVLWRSHEQPTVVRGFSID